MKCKVCSNEYPEPELVNGIAYFICEECGNVHEVINYHGHTKEQVIDEIEIAFSGTVLGDGVGLFEAQALDDYESKKEQRRQRKKDEKKYWALIPNEVLQRCHSSLSFFDADGMRFHLPAYIIGSMEGEVDDPLFHLTKLDHFSKSKLSSLTSLQIQAVISYLTWCLTEDEYAFDYKCIETALSEYWTKIT